MTNFPTTTIPMRSSPSPVKSELDRHRNERCKLHAQGMDRPNEDPGPTSTTLALKDPAVDAMIRSFDETEIALLKQYIDFLEARIAFTKSQNDLLAEENRQLREQLQVASFQSHSDEQDWAYITNGPSSPYVRSGSPSSSSGGFEEYPLDMDLD